ncbi:MAG: hypothetical protein MUF63_13200 [Rhodobacteraceae bacterium]|nr:hypothetical protein [Paracoccaceae bacterium]
MAEQGSADAAIDRLRRAEAALLARDRAD